MKISEIRALNPEELKKQLDEAHRELFNLRFRLTTRQLVNHREIPKARKKIAQLETVIREKAVSSK